jgi:hypothetical protein
VPIYAPRPQKLAVFWADCQQESKSISLGIVCLGLALASACTVGIHLESEPTKTSASLEKQTMTLKVRDLSKLEGPELKTYAQEWAAELYKVNCKHVRAGNDPIKVERVPKYEPVPEDISKASKEVLKKTPGMTVAAWLRAVNQGTAGKYSESQLKGHLETLIGDEVVTDRKAEGTNSPTRSLSFAETD